MNKIKEFIQKIEFKKLFKYISLSILITYMILNIYNLWGGVSMYTSNTENSEKLEQHFQMIQEIIQSNKRNADEQLEMKDGGVKNEYVVLRSKYPESIACLQTGKRFLSDDISALYMSFIIGITIGIAIYMYTKFNKIWTLSIGYLVLGIILFALYLIDINIMVVSFNTDLMGTEYTAGIIDDTSLFILSIIGISLIVIKILKNFYTAKKLNKLIEKKAD